MRTGFYDLTKFQNRKKLREFFKNAIMLSYDTHVEVLDCNISFRRQNCTTRTIIDMLNDLRLANHNVCIDRSVQDEKRSYGEIGSSTIYDPSYFLYIFVTLENLQYLVNKYKLEERV